MSLPHFENFLTARWYADRTVNLPSFEQFHTSLSEGNRLLKGIFRIISASSAMNDCRIFRVFQARWFTQIKSGTREVELEKGTIISGREQLWIPTHLSLLKSMLLSFPTLQAMPSLIRGRAFSKLLRR